ncbi:MAG: hypothetical protein HOV97_05735 [Nonomuraea sp.]|nr:hypothetical protein [Nonomuraea sp.]
MGLDCTAVSKLVHVGRHYSGAYCEDEGHFTAFAYEGFEQSMRGLLGTSEHFQTGFIGGRCYAMTPESETFGWRAGSYGGYNAFRRELAALLGHTVEDYWHGLVGDDEPFYELINFADNEGTIGPEAAADLLADFRAHRDSYLERHADEWSREGYDDWIKALEIAADGGLVDFH